MPKIEILFKVNSYRMGFLRSPYHASFFTLDNNPLRPPSIILNHRIAQHHPHHPVEIKEPGDPKGDEDQDAPDDHVADRGDQVEIAAQLADRATLLVEHFGAVQHRAVEVIGKDEEREAEGDER